MVIKSCKFDPVHDLKDVEPFGFVDLKNAFVERCVPSQVGESDADYNGIDNPDSILGKPADVFEALDTAAAFEKAAAAAASNNNQTDGK